MSLQSISMDTANKVWNWHQKGITIDFSQIQIETIGLDGNLVNDVHLESLVNRLEDVKGKVKGPVSKASGGSIDSEITEIIHSELIQLADVLSLSQI